ncbi:hypothetical protein [Microbispora sp. NPDC049125]|uniref:hypothetical protein n=1 Tax=Microbispora sp. NPDC049125 TaxID=3154929 RepID=UPI0034675189
MALIAAIVMTTPLLVATAAAWLVYALPHFVYHVSHPLEEVPMQVTNVAVLTVEVVLPLVGLAGVSVTRRRRT